ncbi:MAG TPA: hypothetical protein VMV68_06000 [Spirochaetia bacterium]|nr:hypothetical protein [Spirochaetia bacterium]
MNEDSSARRRISRTALLLLYPVLLLLPAIAAHALSVHVPTVDARAGMMWTGNFPSSSVTVPGGGTGAPSPLLNDIGVSVPLSFGPHLALSPEMDFYSFQYQLANDGVTVVPTEIETGSYATLMTIVLDLPVRYEFRIDKSLSWGVQLGPAFFFHIPTATWGTAVSDYGAIVGYFYHEARFFYPEAGVFFTWQALPRIGLELRLRSFFPVFHLWDGSGASFADQLIIDGSVGLRFSIGK